jgi:hypothetical protein
LLMRNTVEQSHDRSPRAPHASVSGLTWECTDAAAGSSARADMSAEATAGRARPTGPGLRSTRYAGAGSAFRMASSTRWLTTLLEPPGGIETP